MHAHALYWLRLLGALLAIPVACGPATPILEPDATTTTSLTSTVPTTNSSDSTGYSATATSDLFASSSSEISAASEATCGDACNEASSSTDSTGQPDMGRQNSCNPHIQDCPQGQKCSPHASEPGLFWNSASCFPVMENPAQIGEPCVVQGFVTSGVDNCDVGAICWEGDHDGQGEFKCASLCEGAIDDFVCPPGSFCSSFSEALAVCETPVCDPLVQDCPETSDVCVPNIYLTDDWCLPDESGGTGQINDPCTVPNGCDKGLTCVGSDASIDCDPNATGCCQPFCEIGVDLCGPGQECLLYFSNTSKTTGVCQTS
jgi:hypothetical protein